MGGMEAAVTRLPHRRLDLVPPPTRWRSLSAGGVSVDPSGGVSVDPSGGILALPFRGCG